MREYLREGTMIRFQDGACYRISGEPIGEGGGSIVYPAIRRRYLGEDEPQDDKVLYALKECFPVSTEYSFVRTDSGEISPAPFSEAGLRYLNAVQNMQLKEHQITEEIYKTGFRLTPVVNSSRNTEISFDEGRTFSCVQNTVTVMESIVNKGRSLKSYLNEQGKLSAIQSFRIIEQVLFAVREVHQAGFLHLDIQDGNVFIKGSLADNSNIASLIDFGAARKMEKDGKCHPIENRVIFSTAGFSAPEMILKNDGTLRLGPEADIYSIGYLLLLMLTGQRKDPRRLYAVQNGCYLTSFDFRKIKCPVHLKGKLQKILARALANEPEDRYHSCDEMLQDVSDFAAALQPYRGDLSQVIYDAFICYKHGPMDSVAAKKLQEYLEHFPISRTDNQKKIQRIFLDEGELSSCADFGQQIEAALREAGWLIVICSSETKHSRWVREEIQTFLKYHDRSRILAVILEGEPEDVFPEELGGADEVLAADARAKDRKEMLKKLRKDAILRIAAPILGTTYDTLKQRHRTYWLQRTAAASIAMAAILTIFLSYTLYQSICINEQYQIARENQARYLSSISLELFAEGDRDKALLTALAVEPEKDSDGAVVPEQVYALNTALASYKGNLTLKYTPGYIGEAETAAEGILSSDGKYYYTIDKAGHVCVLSGENGRLLWQLSLDDIKEAIQELYQYKLYQFNYETLDQVLELERIQAIIPLEQNKAVICLYESAVLIDSETKKIIYSFLLEGGFSFRAYAQERDLLAYATGNGEIYVYNLINGKKEAYLNFNQNSQIEYGIECVSFDQDGTALAIGLSYEFTSQDHEMPVGLAIYDLKAEEITAISEEQTIKVRFTDDSHVAAIHFQLLQNQIEYSWGVPTYSYCAVLYKSDSKDIIFRGNAITSLYTPYTEFEVAELFLNNESIHALIVWIRGNLSIVDINSGAVLAEILYQPDIIGVSAYDDHRLYVGLSDGTVQIVGLGAIISRSQILQLSGISTQFLYNPSTKGMILFCGERIVYCDSKSDPNMERSYDIGLDSESLRVYYEEAGGQIYRYLNTDTEIAVFPVNSTECLYSYSVEEGSVIKAIGFGGKGKDVYLAFTVKGEDGKQYFIKADVCRNRNLIYQDVTEYQPLDPHIPSSVICSKDMESLFVKQNKGIIRFDISGDTMIPDDRAILAKEEIDEMDITGDGEYLILTVRNTDHKERSIYTYALSSNILNQLDINYSFSNDYRSNFAVTAQETSQVCFYDGGDSFVIADCETGLTKEIPASRGIDYKTAFFNEDQYLIILAEDSLSLYSLRTGEVVYNYRLGFSSWGLNIITDHSSSFFGLKDASISENLAAGTGMNHQTLYVFYVDDNGNFYRFADVDLGYASFSGGEILVSRGNTFSIAPFYDYAYLKKRALDILDGKKLTAEERLEYFIGE